MGQVNGEHPEKPRGSGVMNIADELQKLQELRQSGAINDDEFARAKASLLDQSLAAQPVEAAPPGKGWFAAESQEAQTRRWACLLHLSILSGFVIPIAGLAVPILIWQLKKDTLPGIDVHGKNALNWIISKIIYAVVCVLLIFAIIGIPLLVALGVAAIVFPIIAGIKANNGQVWKYPLAISFLK
jgi:uncharacterized Tic20 family protein